ncbi:MAG: SDR family NAD(P)-dependent oxidoreductase, partial [Nitrospinota bacterium]
MAIVTGGAVGIGLSAAEGFARGGAHTVIADIDEERGSAEARRLADEGCSTLYSKTNVRDSTEVKEMVEEAMAQYGRMDILVNNAGGWFGGRTLLEVSEEEWDEIIDLNLKSVFLCCKAVVPHMMEQRRGRIVSVSSLAGRSAVQP